MSPTDSPIGPPGLIRRIPLLPHEMTERITPIEHVFMLTHLGIPEVADAGSWTVEIGGMVRTPMRLTLEELKRFPRHEVESVHECAGNPFRPDLPARRVCNAVWGGAQLADILQQADPKAGASHVWSFGADAGAFAGHQADAFAKDMPIERLALGDVLVAYELNGEPLPMRHGFPVRLFVPGFYGTNSVKWLRRIELADQRLDGLFTMQFYNDAAAPGAYDPRLPARPVWHIAPEAVIVSPAPGDIVSGAVEVWGWCWSHDGIDRVEISDDAGATWKEARVGPRYQWSWQRFSYLWEPGWTGETPLACRARSRSGAVQPAEGARNAIHSISVNVQDSRTRALVTRNRT